MENLKKGNKQPKIKKKQPLKVVYITNPIKFKTSASEFRSLVQELTGQDSDLPESCAKFSEDGCAGGSLGFPQENSADPKTEAPETGDRNSSSSTTVHALEDVRKIGQDNGDAPEESDSGSFWSFSSSQDPSSFGYNEIYSTQFMVEELQGLVDSSSSQEAASHFDVLKRLNSM